MAHALAFMCVSIGCGDGCGCDEDDPEPSSGCSSFSCGWEPPDRPLYDLSYPDLPAPSDHGGDPPDGPRPPGACPIGAACDDAVPCLAPDATCLEDSLFSPDGVALGGPSDPILNHPEGPDHVVPAPLFPGGLCTTSFSGVTATVCDPSTEAGDERCGDCASCVDLFGQGTEGLCLSNCEPNLIDNSDCRDGYACTLGEGVCAPGCHSDDQCRITREETNGVPGSQPPAVCAAQPADCTPADCSGPAPADPDACATPELNFDPLVYDTESSAVCDPATFRCTGRPSEPTAAGGDPCTASDQCEPEGTCLTEDPDTGRWVGGTCSKIRCDLPGNECANGGVCQSAGVELPGCFQGCSVGGFDVATDPAVLVAEGAARTSCREGYGCYWGGVGAGGDPDNGVCLPVAYAPTVTTPNVGAACTADAECYSPFGAGLCLTDEAFPDGYCSVRNCMAPWLSEGDPAAARLCGAAATCLPFDAADRTLTLCLQTCASAEECGPGLGCVATAGDDRACWRGCETDADCRASETCTNPGTPDSACTAPSP